MSDTFVIRLAGRVVDTRQATSARHALFDFLRASGCTPEEIRPMGTDTAAWRGAVYRAEQLADGSPDPGT